MWFCLLHDLQALSYLASLSYKSVEISLSISRLSSQEMDYSYGGWSVSVTDTQTVCGVPRVHFSTRRLAVLRGTTACAVQMLCEPRRERTAGTEDTVQGFSNSYLRTYILAAVKQDGAARVKHGPQEVRSLSDADMPTSSPD